MSKETQSEGTRSEGTVRYAVVGLGHIAQVGILPGFETAENSKLVALVSKDGEKREQLGKKYNVARVCSYEEFDQVLPKVDAVYIALPNHLHREYAVRAADAGVHVLCEKPMAVTEEECQAMIEAAQRNEVKLMVAYRLHFERGNLEAIRLVNSGEIGEPRFFTSEFAQQVKEENVRVTEPVSRGGGPVYDMGVYCINAARYLFRAEPTEIFAMSANNGESRFQGVDEMMSVVMRFPGERLASFTCSFGAADIGRYAVVGTKGSLTADPGYEYAEAIKHHVIIGDHTTTRTFSKRDQFAAEIVYFSDCILRNKEPEPSGLEGLADVRIVRAIYESAQTRMAVELPESAMRIEDKERPDMDQEIHRPAHGKPRVVNAEPPGEAA
jgi:predicted dehydrogenase